MLPGSFLKLQDNDSGSSFISNMLGGVFLYSHKAQQKTRVMWRGDVDLLPVILNTEKTEQQSCVVKHFLFFLDGLEMRP